MGWTGKIGNCVVDNCGKYGRLTTGMCPKHYERWRLHGHTDDPVRPQRKPCSVSDCGRLSRRNGFCETHATRFAKHGDPLKVLRRTPGDDEARFLQYVSKTDGCWLWTGVQHKTRRYGRFYVGGRGGRFVQAHRWAYEHYVGPIPSGLTIDHLCMVRECVNPAHMEPVTQAENNRRAARARMARKQSGS